jgi:uncharacterized protein (DUF58 family)
LGETFIGFLIFLFVLAVIVREDFVFTVLYLFAGTYLIGGWWSRKALSSVSFKRNLSTRVFLNEEIPVQLEIRNSSWLPVIWLRIEEGLPVELAANRYFRHILSLGPYEKKQFDYPLLARRRGYYRVGPLFAHSGDLLGLFGQQNRQGGEDFVTVYPKIVPLANVRLPSQSPLGTLRHSQPIFEDPSRVLSKRDYVAGDSLRRVDWKATATTGRLQVKQFEPSIALETAIFLNLNTDEYDLRGRFDATELGIIVTASLANWIAGHKQTVGFYTNGLDPFSVDPDARLTGKKNYSCIQSIPPRKGRSHLMRILDSLARVEAGESLPFAELLRRESVNLTWGTTLILVTGQADEALFDQLFQVRRAGQQVVLILVGWAQDLEDAVRRAETFNIPLYKIRTEKDLDLWRQ